ncbi:type II toxin-antitoxin system VapC family toxin [Sphingomonas sp. RB3P16]|uniref:type II toxin-antitoxin system VapC family toxin n=1 Tax=Parasphingomonas frigoris TaxID=3096163 RepID=UPI002FCB28DF
MSHYCDASVIGTLVFRDTDWIDVRRWIETTEPSLAYSDFGVGELASAVGRRVRMQQLDASTAQTLLRDFPTRLPGWARSTIEPSDIAVATDYMLNFELGLRFPDAIHIATAERLGLTLVSTDIRQVRAAVSLGVAAINPLHIDGTPS